MPRGVVVYAVNGKDVEPTGLWRFANRFAKPS
jgi:hypothetical protein